MLMRLSGLVVSASLVFTANLLGQAPAYAQTAELQQAENAGVFNLPAGDYRNSPDYVAPVIDAELSRPRIPIGDAALAAIKNGPRTATVTSDTDYEPVLGWPSKPDQLSVKNNCSTNAPTGFAPPDIHGAVSKTRLVVVTNVDIGIYNKTTCAQLSFVPLSTFFNGFTIPGTETLFDPKVIWDPKTQRFFVTVESRDSGNTDQFLYFAVSTDQNATSWGRWRFVLSRASTSTTWCKNAQSDFYDYPNTGVNRQKWFVTSNNFPTSGSAYGTIISIDKAPTTGGAGTVRGWCWSNLATNIAPPIVWDDNRKATFLSPGSGGGSSITRYKLKTRSGQKDIFSTPSAYAITAWTGPPDCAQPNGQKLDTLDGRFQSASIQYGSNIWNAHTVDGADKPTRIRWYRLKTGASGTVDVMGGFGSFQSNGCVFNPSFATSNKKSAFITLSETSPNTNAAFWVWYGKNSSIAGWQTDVVFTSTSQFNSVGGSSCNGSSRGSCRWGDYSSAQVDPSNSRGRKMWGCNQLANGASQFTWATRCAKVKR